VLTAARYSEYVLTPKGKHLFAVIVTLRQWAQAFLFAPGEPHSVLVEKRTVGPCRHKGCSVGTRPLKSDDTVVRKGRRSAGMDLLIGISCSRLSCF
jgi:hypothetical protein